VGAPDDTHTALADLLEKLIAADQDPCRRTPFSPQHSARPGIGHPAIRGGNSTATRLHDDATAAGGVCFGAQREVMAAATVVGSQQT